MLILHADCVTQNTYVSPDTFVNSPVNHGSLGETGRDSLAKGTALPE